MKISEIAVNICVQRWRVKIPLELLVKARPESHFEHKSFKEMYFKFINIVYYGNLDKKKKILNFFS